MKPTSIGGFSSNGPTPKLPIKSAVPGMLSQFQNKNPVNTALKTAAQPDWQKTLNTVQSSSGWKPSTSGAQPVSTGGQSKLPTNQTPGLLTGSYKGNAGGTSQPTDPNAAKRADLQSQLGTAQTELTGKLAEQKAQQDKKVADEKAAADKAQADKTSYQGLVGQGQDLYSKLPGLGQQAADLTARAQQEYADIGKRASGAQAGYSTTGTTPVAEGNAAVIARTAAAQQGAVTQGAQLGLSGLSQQAGNITSAAAGQAGLAGLNPNILRYRKPDGGQMTAEEATAYEAKLSAIGEGVKGSAVDKQNIAGAQNALDSLTELFNKSTDLNKAGINALNATYQELQANLSSSELQTMERSINVISEALAKVTGSSVADAKNLLTSSGSSILQTINNAVSDAKGIAEGKVSGLGGGGTSWTSSSTGITYKNLPNE